MTVTFTVPGQPVPKKRPRFSITSTGRVVTYPDAGQKEAEAVVARLHAGGT